METTIKNVNETKARLPQLTGLLESILSKVEPDFLQLGRRLQSIHAYTEELIRMCMKPVQAIGAGTEGCSLTDANDLAKQSLALLDGYRSEIEGSLLHVEESISYLERLNKICPKIRSIARTLNIIALNIEIESSRSTKCEEMFNFFVKEIRELGGNVSDVARAIKEDSEETHKTQIQILETVNKTKTDLSAIADDADNMIMESLTRIENLLGISARILEETAEGARKISSSVGEVVTAIQFHDIARQQIEHIIEATMEVAKHDENENNSEGHDVLGAGMPGEVQSVLRIQAAQVNQVIKEISQVQENIFNAFKEIEKDIEHLEENTDFLLSNTGETESEGLFDSLVKGFSNLTRLLDQGHGLAQMIEEAMATSSKAASRLSLHILKVEEISADLHLKAINAILMSNRLGEEGRPQAVLAQDVTQVSNESNDFVGEVVEIINSISGLSGELDNLVPDCEQHSSDKKGRRDNTISTSIDVIAEVYRQFMEESIMVSERACSLKGMLAEAETGLSFLDILVDQLKECLEILEETIRFSEPPGAAEADQRDSLGHTSNRYTMEIERDIHNQVFKSQRNKSSEVLEKEREVGEFGDNVELF